MGGFRGVRRGALTGTFGQGPYRRVVGPDRASAGET
ncbi:hypothetical protein F8R89_18500 [Streptomyces sp. SS1-1]|nr:hypothetical protein F8R89_18500 [Streptomyces sp. SS1-1]